MDKKLENSRYFEDNDGAGITLGEALSEMKKSNSFKIEDHQASDFMEIPDYIPVNYNTDERMDRASIIGKISQFAGQITGEDSHPGSVEEVPLHTYHSFFDYLTVLDEMAVSQASELKSHQVESKDELDSFRQFLYKKGEEVSEDLVYVIAGHLSEKYPEIYEAFKSLVDSDEDVELAEKDSDQALKHYAYSSSVIGLNLLMLWRLSESRRDETDAKADREKITNRLVDVMNPDLHQLDLYNYIKKFIN